MATVLPPSCACPSRDRPQWVGVRPTRPCNGGDRPGVLRADCPARFRLRLRRAVRPVRAAAFHLRRLSGSRAPAYSSPSPSLICAVFTAETTESADCVPHISAARGFARVWKHYGANVRACQIG
ncbi:MAG: hypothetical protein Kow00123_09460 [Anaerolineales bacterium]